MAGRSGDGPAARAGGPGGELKRRRRPAWRAAAPSGNPAAWSASHGLKAWLQLALIDSPAAWIRLGGVWRRRCAGLLPQDGVALPPRPAVTDASRRATLLAHNAGIWEGTFVRLEGQADGEAVEVERFASRLQVEDRAGRVEADLTNRSSGSVRSMRFAEPPPEMQITAAGHWSLGPDRIGAWPWVCELCLTAGERRRRVVVRLEGERLISLVVVVEARPGVSDPPSPPLWRLPAISQAGGLLWRPASDLEVCAASGRVELAWQPQPGRHCRLARAYTEFGMLLPLAEEAGG